MSDLGILKQALNIKKANKKNATHFALCNGEKIRYLIAINGGKSRLSVNISTYSKKLTVLMKALKFIPFEMLNVLKLGYYVNASMHQEIVQSFRTLGKEQWNVIVGTYDEKQKVVFQCFNPDKTDAVFIKVGNLSTREEMTAEIEFLREKKKYSYFTIPEFRGCKELNKDCPFSILMTDEFKGSKVEPVLTEDIIRIYQELSSDKQFLENEEREFSHGDFAPWNIKKEGNQYVVFDWEHCGYRMVGFDLMHYVMVVEIILNHKSIDEAFDEGLIQIQAFLPGYQIDKKQFIEEYNRLRLE